jgi:hypothetical protein
VIAGIQTGANDPTGFHNYQALGFYDSRPAKFSGLFNYQWQNRLGITDLLAEDMHTYFYGLEKSNDSRLFSWTQLNQLFPNTQRFWGGIGYMYNQAIVIDETQTDHHRDYYMHGPQAKFLYINVNNDMLDASPVGDTLEVNYTRVFNKTLDENYNQWFGSLSHSQTKWLPQHHVLALTVKGATVPNKGNLFLGSTTTQAEFTLGPALDGFVIRGYDDGEFIGTNMVGGTAEYRFPIWDVYHGPRGNGPYFGKRLLGDVFVDSVALDGAYFDKDDNLRATNIHRVYLTSGAELKYDTTLLYQLPVTIKLVLAYGFASEAKGGFKYYVTFAGPQF